MTEPIPWHELLVLILLDFFDSSPIRVEAEKDLSLKKQFLDVVLVRQGPGEVALRLPDGLAPLAAHTLVTFKSFQETLDEWALWELAGHYVNYRKQVSPSLTDLLPEEDFRLIAVTTRFPRDLAARLKLEEVQPGVYNCPWGTRAIRLLVLHQLPLAEHNALLLLFSALPQQVAYAVEHYQKRSPETCTLVDQLLARYGVEGVTMPKTLEEFRQYYLRAHVHELPPEERLKGLPSEEFLKRLSPEERVKGLPPEERVKGLPPEEILKRMSVEEIQDYLRRRLENGSAPAQENANE